MKVAYIVSDISYPPTEGLHQQTLLLIKRLRQSGVEVDLHGFTKSLNALDEVAMLKDLGLQFASPARQQPGSLLLSALRNLLIPSRTARELRQVLARENYDVVHAEGISACCVLRRSQRSSAVFSFVDPGSLRNYRFHRLSRALKSKMSYLAASCLFFGLEHSLRYGKPLWHVVSHEDQAYLQRTHRYPLVRAIPISLPSKLEDFAQNSSPEASSRDRNRIRILVYADLRQQHMRDGLRHFAQSVFQELGDRRSIEYVVLGRVERDREMTSWFNGLNCEFIKWVDDYLDVLESVDIVVLPDQIGTGLKNRAIQSMAASVPVLGTSVAFEGVHVVNGEDAFVAKGDSEAVDFLERLIGDAGLRERMGRSGRARVLSDFGSRAVLEQWLDTYESVCDDPLTMKSTTRRPQRTRK